MTDNTEREALAGLLGAKQDDRAGGAPVFAGMVLHPRQAYAIADAILASDVWRNRQAKLDYYDPQRQDSISEHDCDWEDGKWWFGHGMPCRHPELHAARPVITDEAVERAAAAIHQAEGWRTPLGSYEPIYRKDLECLARTALEAAFGETHESTERERSNG